ncbi:MAG: flagellar basal body rod protein FlgB [Alteromonadaceae bacterium]|nr:MAG: flagellar basal body rod protein FlgB [Alteromonadaceae bacterium]
MGMSFEKAVGFKESALLLRAQRATVLAGNIANIDTPNYKARDINFHEALKAQSSNGTFSGKGLTMSTTSGGHLGSAKDSGMGANQYYRTPSQPSIDGNTVEESVEHANYMQNSLEFQVAFTLLNGNFKGLTQAIRGE